MDWTHKHEPLRAQQAVLSLDVHLGGVSHEPGVVFTVLGVGADRPRNVCGPNGEGCEWSAATAWKGTAPLGTSGALAWQAGGLFVTCIGSGQRAWEQMVVTAVDKLLIWDFDDTLAYRAGGMWSGALLEVVATAAPGLRITAAQLRPFLQSGFPWHAPQVPHPELQSPAQWWDALDPVFARAFEGVGIAPSQARRLARMVRTVYPDPARWRLFDDSLAALIQLTQAGWSHVILSNHVPELPRLVDHLGLLPYIVRVFCSAWTGYEKPHPMAFRIVLDAFTQTTQVWMVGDSMEADVEGARSVGIPGILVRRHHPEASHQCLGLAELPDIICMTR